MRKILFFLALSLVLACNLPTVTPTAVNSVSQGNQAPTLSTAAVVEVPVSLIQIDGVSYQAYQMPGDPFRFLCQQPCKADANLIDAQYAGFRQAYELMLKLTGVDVLPELQPVDIHLTDDQTCGKLSEAGALSFAGRGPAKNGLICTFLFEYAQGFNGQPYSPEVAVRLDQQTIFIHEYLHLIFFGRLPSAVETMHDFVTPLGLYIGHDLDPFVNPCTYRPETPPGDFGGRLFNNLCTQNGFSVEKLAPVMVELDKLYQSGSGQVQEPDYRHPVPSATQFRDLLNRQLGADTTQAFADACWPAGLFGNSYTLPAACLITPTVVTPTPVK